MNKAGLACILSLVLMAGMAAAGQADQLAQGLQADNATTRIESARALANLGEEAAPAAEQLVEALADEYWEVRKSAAQAIGGLGSAGEPLVEDILARTESDVPGTRLAAIEALGRLGSHARAASDGLVELGTQVDDEIIKAWLIWSVGRVGPPDPNTIGWMLDQARHRDDILSETAVSALAGIGPDAIPPLFAILQNTRDHRKVGAAAKAVGQIGKPAVKPTIEALQDGERYLPSHAVRIAGAIGEPAIPSLIDLLSDEDHRVRERAREALAKIGKPAVAPLVKVLRQQESLRGEVLRVLAEMEGLARPAADAVAEIFLETDDNNVRHRAMIALGEIGQAAASKAVLHKMIAVLRSDQDRVKDDAARALERMGSAAGPVVDDMIDVLPSLKGRTKSELIRAIGNQKQAAADGVDELTAALKAKDDRRVRENAAWALGQIGAAARPALDDLQAAAKGDENRGVRERAERSAGRIRDALNSEEN